MPLCCCGPAGVLSMGRYDDPNSGASSFSMLLGDAPHLDMQYTIFALSTLHRSGGTRVRVAVTLDMLGNGPAPR